MKDSRRSGLSSRIGCIHPSICRAQNVEIENPSQAAPLRSFCYLCILTVSPINKPPPLPCQQFSTTDDNRTSGRHGSVDVRFFNLRSGGPRVTKEMRKIPNQLPCNSQFSPQRSATTSCNYSCRLRCVGKILAFYAIIPYLTKLSNAPAQDSVE